MDQGVVDPSPETVFPVGAERRKAMWAGSLDQPNSLTFIDDFARVRSHWAKFMANVAAMSARRDRDGPADERGTGRGLRCRGRLVCVTCGNRVPERVGVGAHRAHRAQLVAAVAAGRVTLGWLPRVRVTGDRVRLADVEDRDGREADALLDLKRAGLVDGGFALPGTRGEDPDAGLAFADTAAGIDPRFEAADICRVGHLQTDQELVAETEPVS